MLETAFFYFVLCERLFSYRMLLLEINMDRFFSLQAQEYLGEEVEPPRRFASVGSRLFLYIPQDKEGYGSETSHEENVVFIFEESSAFRYNPLCALNIGKSNNLLEKSLVKRKNVSL
ncbi:hypothetical protein [Bacillus sp. MRMR6]|uniref:hypothetical protein n=1 Tax=Bacillus sp. MRMR6 TaxID=1928617 RepID=UPI00095203DA|nr:hypothetical protein [Bacillus sp. MRMR6]OLS41664.1 hypothetical protein BTR25_03710 [Bacillus sp. MRMR6]